MAVVIVIANNTEYKFEADSWNVSDDRTLVLKGAASFSPVAEFNYWDGVYHQASNV